jgi:hypothetical protein
LDKIQDKQKEHALELQHRVFTSLEITFFCSTRSSFGNTILEREDMSISLPKVLRLDVLKLILIWTRELLYSRVTYIPIKASGIKIAEL